MANKVMQMGEEKSNAWDNPVTQRGSVDTGDDILRLLGPFQDLRRHRQTTLNIAENGNPFTGRTTDYTLQGDGWPDFFGRVIPLLVRLNDVRNRYLQALNVIHSRHVRGLALRILPVTLNTLRGQLQNAIYRIRHDMTNPKWSREPIPRLVRDLRIRPRESMGGEEKQPDGGSDSDEADEGYISLSGSDSDSDSYEEYLVPPLRL